MMMMMMIKVSDVGHKLPGLNPAPDIAFLPHPVLHFTMLRALHFTIHPVLLHNTMLGFCYTLHFTLYTIPSALQCYIR